LILLFSTHHLLSFISSFKVTIMFFKLEKLRNLRKKNLVT
jgi:hypothetical protein